ncbi:hypothetical protein BGX28_007112 [Mortierella sp. GBA30]|nr:hypothetical protein BGX28_007112 [Mortierella sp. GBA30]
MLIKSLVPLFAISAVSVEAMFAHYTVTMKSATNGKVTTQSYWESFYFNDCVGHSATVSWDRAFVPQSLIGGCDRSGEFCVWSVGAGRITDMKFKVNGVENNPAPYDVTTKSIDSITTYITASYGKC